MTHEHTPGPWISANESDLDTDGVGIFARNAAGVRYYIATASYMGSADVAPAIANSRLIASAPDLLEVAEGSLEYLLNLPEQYRPDEAWLAPLRAAINRAKEKD